MATSRFGRRPATLVALLALVDARALVMAAVEELRLALLAFKERYNQQWLAQRHGHRTPVALHEALRATTEVAA